MELNETLDMGTQSGGNNAAAALTSEMKNYLSLAAYWAKFLGIFSYVISGIITLFAIMAILGMGFLSSLPGANTEAMPAMGGIMVFVGIIYLGIAYLMFYIGRSMHQFGVKTQYAITEDNDTDLTMAFKHLKSFFRTQGIFTAIFVGFYAIILVFVLLIGGTTFFMR